MRRANPLTAPGRNAALPRARARYLAQAIQLEENRPFAIIGASVYLSVLLLAAAIAWAATTEVSEVAATRGEALPAGLIHDIQHLEGGIVSEIAVRDGDAVKQGDLLLRFAPPASLSEYTQTRISKASLEMEAERLQAIVERREPDFSELSSRYPDLAHKQLTIYKAQLASHESALRVADAQIRQRHTELLRQQNQAKSIAKEIALLQEQVKMRRQLADQRIVARTDLLATQTRLAEAESRRRTILDGIRVARSAWEEARQHRLEMEARFNKEIELEAGKLASRLAEVAQALVRLKDRVTRLDVYAPVAGIIQGLSITRINAVVKPGQVIMQIVPVEDEMVVETRISPQDIGYVHAGMAADVKIDSYDPARFGSVAGTVRRISASTYLDEHHRPYYRAEIALQKAYLGEHPQDLRIIPGMTVEADIKTGTKTILDYLLRPISRGFQSAFQER